MNTGHVRARMLLIGGHRGLVAHLQHVDLVVGDPAALRHRGLGRAHVHPPIQLEGVRRDDLARPARTQRLREAQRQLQGQVRLARGRGSHHRHEVEIRKRGKC